MPSPSVRPTFRSAVFVAIRNAKGEYLLQLRKNTGFLDGHYDIASGHLEYGESLEQCGVRETFEELGLTIKPEDMKLVAVFQSEFQSGASYVNTIYIATKYTGTPIVGEPDKIEHVAWFLPENFPDKLTIGARLFLQTLGSDQITNHYIGPQQYRELMGDKYSM